MGSMTSLQAVLFNVQIHITSYMLMFLNAKKESKKESKIFKGVNFIILEKNLNYSTNLWLY
nr:MAG TPA: hypothetical protein [Caudoviricetes sp.]